MYRLLIACLCILTLPIHAQQCEAPCAEFCQPCYKSGLCCDGSTVGAIVLGAGAGALAGWAASSDKHRHCSRRCKCEKDEDERLTLSYEVDFNLSASNGQSLEVTPFVTLPDETVILGASETTNGSAVTSELKICDPCCGQYQIGILVRYIDITDPSAIFDNITLLVKVDSSRYGPAFVSEVFEGFPTDEDSTQQFVIGYTYYPVCPSPCK